jgi:hypothetical protein
MMMWKRFEMFYLFTKAFLVSLFLFYTMVEVKQHGWTRLAWGNLAGAVAFTCTTFIILHVAKLKGFRQ